MLVFFFFKQKTAYEMRISDWSSDVCSSDLMATHAVPATDQRPAGDDPADERQQHLGIARPVGQRCGPEAPPMAAMVGRDDMGAGRQRRDDPVPQPRVKTRRVEQEQRSEEHTSELQSLMRISYAVF